jgi:hypothetical protein
VVHHPTAQADVPDSADAHPDNVTAPVCGLIRMAGADSWPVAPVLRARDGV